MKRLLIVGLLAGCCCGCEPPRASTASVAGENKKAPPVEPQLPQFAPPPSADAVAPVVKPVEVEMVRERARPGMTDKGKYDQNIMTSPLTANFSLKEQLMFDVAIPKALQLFEETRNRKPRSHQEFMQEIIGRSNIRLPQLPLQHRYIYDPELGELMVERPKVAD